MKPVMAIAAPAMMEFVHDLLFASDALILALVGAALMVFAGFASWMDRRRSKERPIDQLERVGWVPWTSLFVLSAIMGMGLLTLSLPVLLNG